MSKPNIILIGMPGAGKSTLGNLLALTLKMDFIDTDEALAEALQMPLTQWLEEKGQASFRQMEDVLVSNLHVENCVVATGGSVVYGAAAMQNLKAQGRVVYVEVSPAELQRRIAGEPRPIVWPEGQSFEQLFAEREILYKKYADLTVRGDGGSVEQCCAWLAMELQR